MMKALVRCYRSVESALVDLLVISMISSVQKNRDYIEDAKGLRRSGLLFDLQPWPVYIAREGKISFTGDMKLKSETETDRHNRNLGDG